MKDEIADSRFLQTEALKCFSETFHGILPSCLRVVIEKL